MKLKALLATCVLAFAGQASAAPLVYGTDTVDVQMFVSGSSALQFMIGQVADSLLDPATINVYYDGTSAGKASGSSYRAYFGKASAATYAAYPSLYDSVTGAGKNVLILETGAGGSIQGVTPVTRGVAVKSINLTPATCIPSNPVKTFGTHNVVTCYGTADTTRIPDFGVSDVEPSLLQDTANLPSGTLTDGSSYVMTAAEALNLTSVAALGQTMGVVIGNSVANTDLTSAQIAGVLSGLATDWHTIDPSVASKAKTVVVCRRTNGSGTHATILARVLNKPCSSNGLAAATYTNTSAVTGSGKTAKTVVGTATPAPVGSYVVVENGSSGAVEGCMNAAVNGTGTGIDAITGLSAPNYIDITSGAITAAAGTGGTAIPAKGIALPAGNVVLGELGLDYSFVTGTDQFSFLSIDGVAPTTHNAATGSYGVVTETTFNFNAATKPAAGTANGDIIVAFQTAAGNPTILGAAAIPGVMGLSENKWVASNPDVDTNPVMRVGDSGKSCQPLVKMQ